MRIFARKTLFLRGLAALGLMLSPMHSFAASGGVLFVAAAGPLDSGDTWMLNRLQTALGQAVTLTNGAGCVTADASGRLLVFISASVTSTDVNTKFSNVAVPVWTNEDHLQNYLKFSGPVLNTDYGVSAGTFTQLTLVSPAHYASAGLSGSVTLLTAAGNYGWAVPGPGADIIATAGGQDVSYAYEIGAAMVGMNAPARRFFFAPIQTAMPNLASPGGVALFGRQCAVAPGSQPRHSDADRIAKTDADRDAEPYPDYDGDP